MADRNNLTPLSKHEAGELCDNFQHLAGKLYRSLIIKQIVVGPFDDINKWIFLFHYRDLKNVERAMKYYEGPFYDVLLLLEDDNMEVTYKDLRTYLNEVNAHLSVELMN